MNIQWFDLVQSGLLLILAVASHMIVKKGNSKNWYILAPAVFVASFLFSPVNLTQKNTNAIFINQDENLPERELSKKQNFKDEQNKKLKQLKKESEEKRNEEIN